MKNHAAAQKNAKKNLYILNGSLFEIHFQIIKANCIATYITCSHGKAYICVYIYIDIHTTNKK